MMRPRVLFILMGLTALILVAQTPSPAQARPRPGGWHGGWRGGFYPRQVWGRPYVYPRWYAYPRWGWGAYSYSYPAYYYPYPAYAYPSYLDSYPFGGVSAPPVSGVTTSLYGNPSSGSAAPSPEETPVS